MTIANFGRITPLQMAMLMLAQHRLTRERGRSELLRDDDEAAVLINMEEGLRLLRKITGRDFGYSLMDWHAFLIRTPEFEANYRYSQTWPKVEKTLLAELDNPNRVKLEALAAAS